MFGIALSGGGIRAATIAFGFLRVLKQFGILQKADYLSTVSGGSYVAGYMLGKLWKNESGSGGDDPFANLFEDEDRDRLRQYRRYLAPGGPAERLFMSFRLAAAYLVSTVLNLVWIGSLIAIVWFAARLADVPPEVLDGVARGLTWAAAGLLAWHYFVHPLRRRRLWSSEWLNKGEAIVLILLLLFLSWRLTGWSPRPLQAVAWFVGFDYDPSGGGVLHSLAAVIGVGSADAWGLVIALLVFVFAGFFANPNVLTMHRYYRDRVAEAFLHTSGPESAGMRLCDLVRPRPVDAPYALINTCLNVRISDDESVSGDLSSDYFVLSPLHCGSVLSGYERTTSTLYEHLPLATAMAASGAALSPAMGVHTNRFRAFLMTLFNIRLGYWMPNPKKPPGRFKLLWWPWYHFQELLARSGLKTHRVNVSDGGHIENLGVFELLRRGCRLIIALDASADPEYRFNDLENLVRRAREQLGVEIDFSALDPVELIRPSPSVAYSASQFVVGRFRPIAGSDLGRDDLDRDKEYEGILIYVKSSLRAQKEFRFTPSHETSHNYKRHHPSFPHESTARQFFGESQWDAYYHLGRFMAGDVLAVNVKDEERTGGLDIQELFDGWSGLGDPEALREWLDNHPMDEVAGERPERAT